MTKDEKEKLQEILYEIVYWIGFIDPGLPTDWRYEMEREIEDL